MGDITEKVSKDVIDIGRIKTPPIELDERETGIWNMSWRSKKKEAEYLEVEYFLIAAFCKEFGTYLEMREKTKGKATTSSTKGFEVARPEISIGNTALVNARALAIELGVSLKSRMSIGITKSEKVNVDVMDGLSKKAK